MNIAEVEWEVELDFITLENLSYTRGRDGAKGNPPARVSRGAARPVPTGTGRL